MRLAAENLALIPEANTAAARFWWGTPPDDVPEMRGRKWDYVGKPVLFVCVARNESIFISMSKSTYISISKRPPALRQPPSPSRSGLRCDI